MTPEETAYAILRPLAGCATPHGKAEIIAAALRERDAAWAKAVNDALGICIWPYHEVCDRCRPLRALLEEAGK